MVIIYFKLFNYQTIFNLLSYILYLDLCLHGVYLEQVSIASLSSHKTLSLQLASIEGRSFGYLYSLRDLRLSVKSELNKEKLAKLFESCPNIEELTLIANFSTINFDSFVNLKSLSLRSLE